MLNAKQSLDELNAKIEIYEKKKDSFDEDPYSDVRGIMFFLFSSFSMEVKSVYCCYQYQSLNKIGFFDEIYF